ncbi:ComF family protein [Lewinella sp. 4G2]|uniref:ComF family protein n=1 Tax=Lewinella sp. 4G2 TaxID=1803372 RepID=UPI0007B4B0CE|nr:phosphoribosyltransferase family protein [Lewinella sp. 4G2]
MSFTKHWEYPENELTDRFAGRVPLVFGAAYMDFKDDSAVQSLIHALKYHNRPEVGVELGAMFAEELLDNDVVRNVDYLIPVPIHGKRKRQRGYNQAERIAVGMSEVLGIPVLAQGLARRSFQQSQTKLGKLDRIANVEETFVIGRHDLSDKTVLLIDDVITTGATLDYCSQAILKRYPDARIGVAALALTQ